MKKKILAIFILSMFIVTMLPSLQAIDLSSSIDDGDDISNIEGTGTSFKNGEPPVLRYIGVDPKTVRKYVPVKIYADATSCTGWVQFHIDFGDGRWHTSLPWFDDNVYQTLHTYTDADTYTITAYAFNQYGNSQSKTCKVVVTRARSKNVDCHFVELPFFLHFLEHHPNMFPQLRNLIWL